MRQTQTLSCLRLAGNLQLGLIRIKKIIHEGQAQRLFNVCLSCHTAGCHFMGAYHSYAPPVQHALHALHGTGLCIPSTWLRSNGNAICLSMAHPVPG